MGFREYKRPAKKGREDIRTPEDLLEELKAGKYKSVMLFYGEERLRIENAIDFIKKRLLSEKTNEFNYDVIYCEEGGGSRIYQSFITPPFIGGNKLILAREAEKLKDDDYLELKKLFRFEKFTGSVLIFIYYLDEITAKGKNFAEFFKELLQKRAVYRFDLLDDTGLMKKVQGFLKKYDMTIEPEGFAYLIQEVGNQQDIIFNLLSGLVMYDPSRKRITLEDVKGFIFNFRGFTVYDFTNAIARKRVDEALRILEISGNQRENLIQLVQPIMRMLEQLLRTRQLLKRHATAFEIAQELGLPQRIVESEFIPQARNFETDVLIRSMELMSRFDLMLRTSTLPPEMIISHLLFDLCL